MTFFTIFYGSYSILFRITYIYILARISKCINYTYILRKCYNSSSLCVTLLLKLIMTYHEPFAQILDRLLDILNIKARTAIIVTVNPELQPLPLEPTPETSLSGVTLAESLSFGAISAGTILIFTVADSDLPFSFLAVTITIPEYASLGSPLIVNV